MKDGRSGTAAEMQIAHIGDTPMREVKLLIDGALRRVCLKLEGANPAGSSKDRTAMSLIADLQTRGALNASSVIVESTSGNLGVSLAFICRAMGYPFVAVVDPKTTPENLDKMKILGARIELVEESDENGGYLLSRLKRVQQLCANSSRYVWTNQYSNPANPEVHYRSTGPEIYSQMKGDVEAVLVAVSTGGTLTGIGRYFREISPRTRIIGVDAGGSVVFGHPPGPRLLTGIGASRPSNFVRKAFYDFHMVVHDREAFAMCRQLDDETRLRVGGSSGAVLSACARHLSAHPGLRHVVCLCADGGENYRSTIFSDEWLIAKGFDPEYRCPNVKNISAVEVGVPSFDGNR